VDQHFSESFSDTSLSLLEGARSQDARAWQRLARLYEPLIQHWCQVSQLPAADIPDISQDVLAAVWKNLGDFRKTKPGDSFRGWLKTITRNKIRDHYRKRRSHGIAAGGSTAQLQLQELAEILPDGDSSAQLFEEREVFLRALELIRSEFETRTWNAFWLTVVEGHSAVDAARELSLSAGAVRQSKFRVLRRLRCELGDLVPDASGNAQNV
jgi:RNA polymerase sigma-70 factor (ECF subfamily)